jgi:hypothetical protein
VAKKEVAELPKIATESLRLKILNASGKNGAAGDAREIFRILGFREIAVGNAAGSAQSSVLVYTPIVPEDILESVVNKLKNHYPAMTVTQTATADADILFTIGRDQLKTAP